MAPFQRTRASTLLRLLQQLLLTTAGLPVPVPRGGDLGGNIATTDNWQAATLDHSAHFPAVITVKTTGHNHNSRVGFALKTWLKEPEAALRSTYFVTDIPVDDKATIGGIPSAGRFVDSGCVLDRSWMEHPPEGSTPMNQHLVCKLAFEMKLATEKLAALPEDLVRWWCHFDDDNYARLDKLADALVEAQEDHRAPIWLGRTQGAEFTTGGAGFCMDRKTTAVLAEDVAGWLSAHPNPGPDDVLLGTLWSQRGYRRDNPPIDMLSFNSQFDTPNKLINVWDISDLE
jgi:hypothetical protein